MFKLQRKIINLCLVISKVSTDYIFTGNKLRECILYIKGREHQKTVLHINLSEFNAIPQLYVSNKL